MDVIRMYTVVSSENITSLLLFVLLQVHSRPSNTKWQQTSDTVWYYGDDDFIMWIFNFIARSNASTCDLHVSSHHFQCKLRTMYPTQIVQIQIFYKLHAVVRLPIDIGMSYKER